VPGEFKTTANKIFWALIFANKEQAWNWQ